MYRISSIRRRSRSVYLCKIVGGRGGGQVLLPAPTPLQASEWLAIATIELHDKIYWCTLLKQYKIRVIKINSNRVDSIFINYIGKDHWNLVAIECSTLASKWKELSTFLGLSFDVIDAIKSDYPLDSTACWNEALKQWILQNYSTEMFGKPSWRRLLKSVSLMNKGLFKKLAAKHQIQGSYIYRTKKLITIICGEVKSTC